MYFSLESLLITDFSINKITDLLKGWNALLLKTQIIEKLYSTQLIVAALNEEQGIGPTLTDYIDNLGIMKVLVIDGNSRDKTVEIAKNLGAEITFQDGKGKGNAIAKAVQKIDPKVK